MIMIMIIIIIIIIIIIVFYLRSPTVSAHLSPVFLVCLDVMILREIIQVLSVPTGLHFIK